MDSNDTIGRYVVERLLGRGGMGEVYLARDPSIGRRVAIKVLRTDDDEYRRRFKLEMLAAGSLRHRNIGMLFDSGEHNGSPFLAMEFIPGETLADKIKRQAPLPLSEKLRYVEELCDGLAHAHRAGIIHRDIKPPNVLVDDESDSVKIVDFGIARMAEASVMTQSGLAIGTLSYMSPEQLLGKRAALDPRSDIFSVGLVLYELLSWQRAFPSDDGVMWRIVHEDPPALVTLVPGLDDEVVAIVTRALQKDPAKRYTDAASMAAALHAVRMRAAAAAKPAIDAAPRAGPPPVLSGVPSQTHAPTKTEARPVQPTLRATEPAPVQEPVVVPGRGGGRSIVIGIVAVVAAFGVWLLIAQVGRTTAGNQVNSAPIGGGPVGGGTQQVPNTTSVPASGGQPVAPTASEPRLRVSGPANLDLMLDGQRVSRDSAVRAGGHTLAVRMPGVVGTRQQEFTIAAGETREIAVDAATGTLTAGELPFPFGSVTVDGQTVTRSTRAMATSLVAEFVPDPRSKLGLARRRLNVTVKPGQELTLAALIPQGRFRFEVSPTATVTVDYQRFGAVTQGDMRAAEGAYPITLTRPGYPDYTTKIDVRADRETVARFAYNFATGAWILR